MLRTTAIALAASLIAASPAFADEPEVQTRVVKTADLNLGNPEGRATMEHRIRSAARSVCQNAATITGYGLSAEWRCVQDAIKGTRPRVAELVAAAPSQVAMLNDKPAN